MTIHSATILAVIGKTHGNGFVNDYTRGYLSLSILIGENASKPSPLVIIAWPPQHMQPWKPGAWKSSAKSLQNYRPSSQLCSCPVATTLTGFATSPSSATTYPWAPACLASLAKSSIGHLGDCDDLVFMDALSAVEMKLADAAIPHHPGSVLAAMGRLRHTPLSTKETLQHA